MTDYNKLEKEISREELILKLKIETGLRECYESESAKLKDEIEALKDALHDDEVEIHKLKEETADIIAAFKHDEED